MGSILYFAQSVPARGRGPGPRAAARVRSARPWAAPSPGLPPATRLRPAGSLLVRYRCIFALRAELLLPRPPTCFGPVTARPAHSTGRFFLLVSAPARRRPASPVVQLVAAPTRPFPRPVTRAALAVAGALPGRPACLCVRSLRAAPGRILLVCWSAGRRAAAGSGRSCRGLRFGPLPLQSGGRRYRSWRRLSRPAPRPGSRLGPRILGAPLRALCAAHRRVGAPLPLPLVRRMSCTAGSRPLRVLGCSSPSSGLFRRLPSHRRCSSACLFPSFRFSRGFPPFRPGIAHLAGVSLVRRPCRRRRGVPFLALRLCTALPPGTLRRSAPEQRTRGPCGNAPPSPLSPPARRTARSEPGGGGGPNPRRLPAPLRRRASGSVSLICYYCR